MYFAFSNGIGHQILNIFLSIFMLLYLIALRPFKSLMTTIITILMEISVLLYFFFLFSFVANPRKNYRIKKIWGVIEMLLLVFTVFFILFIVIFFSGKEIINYYLKKRHIDKDFKTFKK